MRSGIPVPTALKSISSTLPGIYEFSFVMMVAGSILKCCVWEERDIGDSRGCGNVQERLERTSKCGVASAVVQKLNSEFQLALPLNPRVQTAGKIGYREYSLAEDKGADQKEETNERGSPHSGLER